MTDIPHRTQKTHTKETNSLKRMIGHNKEHCSQT